MGQRVQGLTTAETCSELSVSVPTLLSWERRYGFPQPTRTPGGHRRYTLEQVDQLRALIETAHTHPISKAIEILRSLDKGASNEPQRVRHGHT